MTYSEKIKHVRPSVVEVLVSGQRHGSGFCVSADGLIITATHVVGAPAVVGNEAIVNYEQNVAIRLADGRTISVQPVTNPSPEAAFHDITLLKADLKTPSFLRLGNPATVQDGEEVYLMGFPLDVPASVTYRGTVSAQFPIPGGTYKGKTIENSTIHVQAPVAKGFSGSPLLRMSDDTVVGVITNKLGGINKELDDARQGILAGQKQGGSVRILGVDPNQTALDLINVLDNYLSAAPVGRSRLNMLGHS